MRATSRRSIKPIPLSTIPAPLLRLPPTQLASAASTTNSGLKPQSPTIDRILKSFASKRFARLPTTAASGDGRGLGASIPTELNSEVDPEPLDGAEECLPSNLRLDKFVPKRKEYEGVKTSHRELVRACHLFFILPSLLIAWPSI